MAPDRDLFANFERMRREMDELFGDVFERGMAPVRRGGFSPAVDVYYTGDPPRAIVRADLAGRRPGGHRARDPRARARSCPVPGPPESGDGRVYQQLEIEHGPFRRVVALGADVDADAASAAYEDGMLIVELPLAPPTRPQTVRIEPERRDEA